MLPRTFVLTLCLAMVFQPARADEPTAMMHHYLMRLTRDAALTRANQLELALESPDAIANYAQPRRTAFLEALGPWPERTPLHAQTTGLIEREGYTIEKVLFESQPSHHVTALLYLPAGEGPHPAVLVPCGHARAGKAEPAYQRASMLLAQNGIAALCFDPIEQGERMGLLSQAGGPVLWGTEAHMALGAGAILLGANTAMYEIWDGIRAIDYLTERTEIDPERIGCAGNSGGGTQTAHLMALDKRIAAAAPNCYITSFPRLLDTIGAQDAEQNLFGQLAHGLDHADFLILRAPKPTMIAAVTHDFFDITGTWESYRDAKRVYTALGYPERVTIIEDNNEHGWSQTLREVTAHWMQRWLLGIDAPVREVEEAVLSDEDARVTETGQVMDLPGERSSFDVNRARLEALKEEREASWHALDDDAKRAAVRSVTGIRTGDAISAARVLHHAPDWFPEGILPNFARITLESEVGIQLPVAIQGTLDAGTVTLLLPGTDEDIESLLNPDSASTAVVFLRGLGPTRSSRGSKGWADRFGSDWAEVFHAYLHAQSYIAMRAEDIIAVAHWLRARGAREVMLHAGEQAAVAALHAAFLEPGLIGGVEVPGGIPSWESALTAPHEPIPFADLIHGALSVYDVPHLGAALNLE